MATQPGDGGPGRGLTSAGRAGDGLRLGGIGRVGARRTLLTAFTFALPSFATLALMVGAGMLGPWPALGGALLVLAGTAAFVVRPYLRDLQAVFTYVDGVARGTAEDPPPLGRTASATGLDLALLRLRRSWTRKSEEVERLLNSGAAVLDSLPDPLLLLDREMAVRRANLAARTLLGPNLVDRGLATVLREPRLLDAVRRVVEGRAGERVEFRLVGRVERELRAQVERLPEDVADDAVAVLSLHDLTQIRRAEQMRVDFVANASHELRTPLTSLIGFVETLQSMGAEDGESRRRFLSIMHEQAARMSRLVDDLLSLSRIELDEHSAPKGRVDLCPLLAEAAASLELRARDRGIRIVVERPPGELPVVGERDQIMQVLVNLMDNAVKYTRPDTRIEVAARRAERGSVSLGRGPKAGFVAVSVRDYGEGIAREHLPRLTERFYRVDNARSRQLGGTGLGLAIVKHIVNRHRGALAIDSETGKGSTFTIFLPAADATD